MSHEVRQSPGATNAPFARVLGWTVVALAVASAGCTRTRIVVGEGIRCSTDEDDNPYNECDATSRLLCFSTYKKMNTNAWLCHRACEPGVTKCSEAGDVCCPAMVYPSDRPERFACVPSSFCDATKNMPKLDGGAANDAGTGVRQDAASPTGEDASVDAPTTDASVDAPTTDASGTDGAS